MEISRRSDYACRIIRAAYQNKDVYVSLSDVAEAEGIPYAFARSIQHDLVRAGYLKTTRGVKGGLSLNCDPATTTVKDILQAIQGSTCIAPCSQDMQYCNRSCNCSFNALWRAADKLVDSLLESITLADLFEQGGEHPSLKALLG